MAGGRGRDPGSRFRAAVARPLLRTGRTRSWCAWLPAGLTLSAACRPTGSPAPCAAPSSIVERRGLLLTRLVPRPFRDLGDVRGLEGRAPRHPSPARRLGARGVRAERSASRLRAARWPAGRGGRSCDYTYPAAARGGGHPQRQAHIYLWPCDCRAIIGACRKPANVCLRFEQRPWGRAGRSPVSVRSWCSSRPTARGLMHTAYFGRAAATTAICNCCADCCFPHLATARLGADRFGPSAPYRRGGCGRLHRLRALRRPLPLRSHHRGTGGGRAKLDRAACRGCGLCATECGPEAVTMRPLA